MQGFVEKAQKEGFSTIEVKALVHKEDKVLLLMKDGEYNLPMTLLQEGESLLKALERSLEAKTGLVLSKVEKYICHFDHNKTRSFVFLCSAADAYEVNLSDCEAYGWVDPKDAMAYPIKSDMMTTLDIYMRLK